jgi:hypothetical protein
VRRLWLGAHGANLAWPAEKVKWAQGEVAKGKKSDKLAPCPARVGGQAAWSIWLSRRWEAGN